MSKKSAHGEVTGFDDDPHESEVNRKSKKGLYAEN